jgi:hypothetical protein
MEKVLYIYFKKSGMKMLGISTGQRIASLFGKSLYIKGHKVEDSSCGGQVRKLFISVNMAKGEAVPDLPESAIAMVRLQWNVGAPCFANGQGYEGDTWISSTTCDGFQQLLIQGKSISCVLTLLDLLATKKFPKSWSPLPEYKRAPRLNLCGCQCKEIEVTHPW